LARNNETPIRVGLLGAGTVGSQTARLIVEQKDELSARIGRPVELTGVACLDPKETEKFPWIDQSIVTTDTLSVATNSDIVIELIGGTTVARKFVLAAIESGASVVTANKALLAKYGPEIYSAAEAKGVDIYFEAAVGGAIPFLRPLRESLVGDKVTSMLGIVNGTTNYILDEMTTKGLQFDDVLKDAQAKGYAEADPTGDIEGYDSLFKLVIITVHALGTYVAPEKIFTYGISTIHDSDIRYAREKNVKIKLVAQVVKVSDEHFTMFVMPEFVTPSKYIYSVDDEYNGVVIRGECYDRQFMFGKGAGSLPTASSILSDIMARQHDYRYEYKKQHYLDRPEYTTDVELKVYVRYTETDVLKILHFDRITEQYRGEDGNYVIGYIRLSELLAKREVLRGKDVFMADFQSFFQELDR